MPIPRPNRWYRELLSPLDLAAYLTWLAVALQSLRGTPLELRWARAELGTVGLLSMLALLMAGNLLPPRPAWRRLALILAEAAAALLAGWLLRNGWTAILLIIVAAQLAACLPALATALVMLIINALLLLQWHVLGGHANNVIVELLPLIAFQAFAALTMHYQASAERRGDELAQLNAQLLATQALLEESSRGEERLKLSRELHDVAGHKLTALKLNLALLARDPALRQRDEVVIAGGLAHELLDDIRGVVSQLRRHDGIDLRKALQAMIRCIPGPRFQLSIEECARPTSVQAAETLLRCAQEGITNALRHGQPRLIELRCQRVGDMIELQLRDDGSLRASLIAGNGLTGMRERLEALGGDLRIHCREPRGVDLLARLPVRA